MRAHYWMLGLTLAVTMACARSATVEQERDIQVDATVSFGSPHFVKVLQEEENGFDSFALAAGIGEMFAGDPSDFQSRKSRQCHTTNSCHTTTAGFPKSSWRRLDLHFRRAQRQSHHTPACAPIRPPSQSCRGGDLAAAPGGA